MLAAQSQALREEGWEVLGYSARGGGQRVPGRTAENLLVESPGHSGRPGIIEVSAHYDTVPNCPGASDNSNGVAALLEIARVLAEHPPERPVRLCFFEGEEQGLLGSRVHIDAIRARDERFQALFNLDSIGHASKMPDSQRAPASILFVTWMPSTGDLITVIGNWHSGPLASCTKRRSRPTYRSCPFTAPTGSEVGSRTAAAAIMRTTGMRAFRPCS